MLPVLLIPGLLCSEEIWGPQISMLWPQRSVQVASTLQGDTVADVARAILDTAPPRFALAGISMGGYFCFEIMRQAADRVDRLALLDTSARPDSTEQSEGRRALLARASREDFATVALEGLTAVLRPQHRNDGHLRAINARMAASVGLSGFRSQTAAAISRPDSRPDLQRIAVPTLVAVGDEDALTPPELSAEIAEAVPGAELVTITRSGHGSTIEQPEQVNAALTRWLERCST